ncbi:MAG TPA: 3-oxoacyl-ACP reductase FabG [Burkholderiales bacterium]|nr:3-oxoacyl-ACP reductase FabG [Burkholderiales bacterium]
MGGAMLKEKVVLVTGASRGIGRAIAVALGKAGATVAGTATSDAGAAGITEYLRSEGLKGAGYKLNVINATETEAVLARIESDHGPVAILVNNAGITRDNLLLRMKDAEWDEIMDTNLKPVFRLSKSVIRSMMKARFGRIINITSVVGSMGNAGQVNYAAAKAGVVGFSKSLAKEVGSRNITVNCIAPGFIDTDMTRELPDDQKNALLAHVPLGRFGQVEEIAAAALFLASDGAAYVTGSTLHVNGGLYMD